MCGEVRVPECAVRAALGPSPGPGRPEKMSMAIDIAAIPVDDRYLCQPLYENCDVWLPVLEARGLSRAQVLTLGPDQLEVVRLQVPARLPDVKAEAGTGKTHKLSLSRGVILPMTSVATNR